MKKRIYWTLFLLSAVGVLSACILTLTVMVQLSTRQAERTICDLTDTISKIYNAMELDAYTEQLAHLPEDTRATLITEDGTVLYDSNASAAQMENHLDRPEIQSALKNGTGEDTRRSSTVNASTYYYAVRLPDNCVLRLSRRYSSIRSIILSAIPGTFVVVVLLFGLALICPAG